MAFAQLRDHVAFQQALGKRQWHVVQPVDFFVQLIEHVLQAAPVNFRCPLHAGEDAGQPFQFLDDLQAQVAAREQVGEVEQARNGGPVMPNLVTTETVMQGAQHEFHPQKQAHAFVERLLVSDEVGGGHGPQLPVLAAWLAIPGPVKIVRVQYFELVLQVIDIIRIVDHVVRTFKPLFT